MLALAILFPSAVFTIIKGGFTLVLFIIIFVLVVIFDINRFKKMKAQYSDIKGQRKFVENYKVDASKNRRAVAEIMKNDQLSAEAKRAKIKELLNNK